MRDVAFGVAVVAGLAGCGRIGFDDGAAVARCPIGPAPGWSVAPGFHAVVVSEALDQPTAVTVAGGAFGDRVHVANHGTSSVVAIDPRTGATETLVAADGWSIPPTAMTALIWDGGDVFDGALYLADRGTSNDNDSMLYAIDPSGATRVVAQGPGPALDDVFSLAFVDQPGYGTGLLVTGDTDGGAVDWARYTMAGGTPFSSVHGVSGIAVDTTGVFGGGIFASRPANTSFAGDDAVAKVSETGSIIYTLAAGLDDVHAAVFAPAGAMAGWLYAATQTSVVRIDPAGTVTPIVGDADFDPLDGNVIAFPPYGNAMYVVSRAEGRLVCVERTEEPAGSLPDAAPDAGGGGGGAIGE